MRHTILITAIIVSFMMTGESHTYAATTGHDNGGAGYENIADPTRPVVAQQGMDGMEALGGLLGSVLGGQRDNSLDEDSSSHSIRGLKKGSAGARAVIPPPVAKDCVRRMESFTVNKSELEQFQREGGVGGYAK